MKLSHMVSLGAGVAIIAGVILLSAAGGTPTEPALPAIEEVRQVTSGRDIVLPFNEYQHSIPEVKVIERATAILARECMHRFGQDWPVPATEVADPNNVAGSGRYGVIDQAEVSQRGYHPPAEQPEPGDNAQTQPTLEAQMVYTGKGAATLNGKSIPDGGCVGEARRKLTEGTPQTMSGTQLAELDHQLFFQAQADPRVREAMARWRACMAESGYHYADIWAANNDVRWSGPAPSAEEIATATTDVACKAKTNLASTWLAVETAYQRQVIAERRAEFDALKKNMRVRIDNAIRVTSTR